MSDALPSTSSSAARPDVIIPSSKEAPSRNDVTKAKARRRTKSGCLTCRKRRIKCTEEKPTCSNCIKSKRHCDGYNPRISFKDFRASVGQAGLYHPPNTVPDFHFYSRPTDFPLPDTMTPLTPIRPRLPTEYYSPHFPDSSHVQGFTPNSDFGVTLPDPAQYPYSTTLAQHASNASDFTYQGWPMGPDLKYSGILGNSPVGSSVPTPTTPNEGQQPMSAIFDEASPWKAQLQESHDSSASHLPQSSKPASLHHWPQSAPENQVVDKGHENFHQPRMSSGPKVPLVYTTTPSSDKFKDYHINTQGLFSHSSGINDTLEAAAVEIEDDDYHDVFSDEDDDVLDADYWAAADGAHRNSLIMHPLQRSSLGGSGTLVSSSFAFEGILDTYRPERVANPLRNPNTARVFAHFIFSTGPMLSIHQRAARGTSKASTTMLEPPQNLWTYTLPMMALHNQSLLHAILALSSLHIAKLQRATTTPSLKHYAYSLKKVHVAVSNERKRHEVTTLAATLLLGFYEVMTAEHLKWSTHLSGAAQLVVEIDYAGIMRRVKELRDNGNVNLQQHSNLGGNFKTQRILAGDDPNAVDERIVSTMMGRTRTESSRQKSRDAFRKEVAEADLHNYEVLQDLYWWYCKQDLYHSMISGNGLLMDYQRWSDCPPRAALGDNTCTYGTFDHIVLLLAGIAKFIASDRARKIQVIAANGGIWRPPWTGPNAPPSKDSSQQPNSSFSTFTSPGGMDSSRKLGSFTPHSGHVPGPGPGPGSNPGPGKRSFQEPAFFGMAPSMGTDQMPHAFKSKHEPISPQPKFDVQSEEQDLQQATREAESEWAEIRAALDLFANSLGPGFQPLSADPRHQLSGPFGPTLTYRSHEIGNIWMHYFTAQMLLLRSHPSMPPAAHVAVGVAARQTAQLANEIGRIASGIPSSSLDPLIVAALPECTIPLFFAGVQFQDSSQRKWTVNRLRNIELRSGWASAGLCALGCETAWVQAADLGRGPPYEKTGRNHLSHDQRVSGKYSHLRDQIPTDPIDRRFVPFDKGARLVWATGVLGTADDLSKMSLGNQDQG